MNTGELQIADMWLMILPMQMSLILKVCYIANTSEYKSVVTIRKRTKNFICADEKNILFYIICVFLPFSVLISIIKYHRKLIFSYIYQKNVMINKKDILTLYILSET